MGHHARQYKLHIIVLEFQTHNRLTTEVTEMETFTTFAFIA